MYRDAERQFKSSLNDQPMIDTYLYLAKVYVRMDQPLTAIEVYKQGLEKFPNELTLIIGQARIHEVIDFSFICLAVVNLM
jgi:tetratricopeptide repeat protein 8